MARILDADQRGTNGGDDVQRGCRPGLTALGNFWSADHQVMVAASAEIPPPGLPGDQVTNSESCEDRDGSHLDAVFGEAQGGDADQRAGRCAVTPEWTGRITGGVGPLGW
ncbi:hypothetical protein NBRGN_038_02100 [Nocardia brasiliensis NBRC 14402]|nr:hypothetical protein NBRGN_038_02100 [Nocardia brasiliensis NBRC 14402]